LVDSAARRSAPGLATLLAALTGTADVDQHLTALEAVVAEHPLGILTDPAHDLTRWAKAIHPITDGSPPRPCTT
jgi:hypothetical protein